MFKVWLKIETTVERDVEANDDIAARNKLIENMGQDEGADMDMKEQMFKNADVVESRIIKRERTMLDWKCPDCNAENSSPKSWYEGDPSSIRCNNCGLRVDLNNTTHKERTYELGPDEDD